MQNTLLLVLVGLCSAFAGNYNINGFFTKTGWSKAMKWCTDDNELHGTELLLGDFNGDGKKDMLCHDATGKLWTYLANKHSRFEGPFTKHALRWCGHGGSRLYVGDFNGDKKSDILCHDDNGHAWIAVMNAAGQFVNYWYNPKFRWCWHKSSELHLGDFNGDGRTDILCHDTSNGDKWVMHAPANGHFDGAAWHKKMGWCYHRKASLLIADFNGDGRDDMMCHDKAAYKWVAFATCHGHFDRTFWHGSMQNWCKGSQARLLTGYFNGDTRADLMCHERHSGKKWIALAHRDYRNLFRGTDWYKNMGWCGSTGQLFIGDFNGDGNEDMLCHQTHTGTIWIAYNHHRY